MLAKKVFFIILIMGLVYLAYQALPVNLLSGNAEKTPQNAEQNIELKELKSTVAALQSAVERLTSENRALNEQMSSLVSEKAAKIERVVQTDTLSKTVNAPVIDATSAISQEQTTSEREKRLKQQAQLRALADKHQLAALNMITD